MIIEKVSPWDLEKTVELISEAATKCNWQIPAIHNLQQSLAKAGQTVKPLKVIEICKPEYSGKILNKNDERIVSVMMPCRISVYEKDDNKTYIALIQGAALAAQMPESIKAVMIASSNEVDQIVDSVIFSTSIQNPL